MPSFCLDLAPLFAESLLGLALPWAGFPVALLVPEEDLAVVALSTLGNPVFVVSGLTVAPVLPPGSGPMLSRIGA